MKHQICDACETVAHCMNNGCVPVTPVSMTTEQKLREALEEMMAVFGNDGHFHAPALKALRMSRDALANPTTPEQGDTHHWPQQGDPSWPPAPEQQAPGFMHQIKAAKESVAAWEPWMQMAAVTASTPVATGCPDTMDDTGHFAEVDMPAFLRKQAG